MSSSEGLAATGATASDRRSRLILVAVAVGCVILMAVLYWLAVRTAWGQRIDEKAVVEHRYDRTPGRDVHRYSIGSELVLGGFGLVVLVLGYPRWRLLAVLSGSIGAAVAIANVLRRVVLPRPALGVFDMLYGPSYPSGHATAAITIAAALFVVCPWPPWARRALALFVAGSIDGLLLFIPIHRPSDVIAGNLLGLAVLCVAMACFAPDLRPVRRDPPREWWRSPLAFGGLAVVEFVGSLAVMSRLAHRSDLSIRAYGNGFIAAVLIVIVAAATVLAVLEWLWSRPVAATTPGSAGGP